MTCESGSAWLISGRLQTKTGRSIVESPAMLSYGTFMKTTSKTVLITGCSTGYGLETARHFHSKGWDVIATMRTPRAAVLPVSQRLRVISLDVTKPESIAAALEESG